MTTDQVYKLELPRSLKNIDPASNPIREPDYIDFEKWFCINEGDKEFLDKLISNIRMIDEPDFVLATGFIKQHVRELVGDDGTFYLVTTDSGKSGDLMIEYLDDLVEESAGVIRKSEIKSLKDNNPNSKFIIVDDASYSGESVEFIAKELLKIPDVDINNVSVCTVGMTNLARNRLEQIGFASIFYEFNIPTTSEILTQEEINYWGERMKEAGGDWHGYDSRVLTFFWYKVPDNFLPGLRKNFCIVDYDKNDNPIPHFLIDDSEESGIYPPYRSS